MYLFDLDKNKIIVVEQFHKQIIEITLIQKTFLFTKLVVNIKQIKN